MSKKHKNRHQQPMGETAPSADVDELTAALGGEAAEADAPEVDDNEEETVEVPAEETTPAEETAAEVPPPPAEEVIPPTPEAKTVDLEKTPVAPVIKIAPRTHKVASAALSRAVDSINAETSDDPHRHTAIGRKLLAMFDEYAELCKKADADVQNSKLQTVAAQKLYDIMTICCPRNGNQNAGVYAEMIRIVFKKLSQGYGTIYKDSNLLRMDYRLPTPADSMKFDAFYTAMWQLVEAAKTGAHITYNTTTLSRILNSPSAMAPITAIRRRIEAAR